MEYAGLIAVVATLIGVVTGAVASASPQLAQHVWCAVRSVVTQSGDCQAGPGGPGPALPPVLAPGWDNAPARPAQRVDPAKLDRALRDIRADLDGNWLTVRDGELSDLESILASLNGAELDAAIAGMSDEELAAWIGELNDGTIGGGWDRARRERLWAMVLAKAAPSTVARIAKLTTDVRPPFDTVGGDSAREDPTSPASRGTYGQLPQTLFATGAGDGNAVAPNDVAQGMIGDCWYIASVMALAQQRPDLIQHAIVANPNGSYTVTLYRDGKPVQITVTPDLPVVEGNPVFVHNGDQDAVPSGSGNYEVWPMVLEKAAAQYYGTFGDLEGDNPAKALALLTGQPVRQVGPKDVPPVEDLAGTLDTHGVITVITDGGKRTPLYDVPPDRGGIVSGHAYYVSAVDPVAGTVTVVNPWGPGIPPTTMTYQQFRENFVEYEIASP